MKTTLATILIGLALADGVPRRVELLKGYGNAIVPQTAAAFIQALIGQD